MSDNRSSPRVLVITKSAWRNSDNCGNTLTNIFAGYPGESIAQLYCSTELPDNGVCVRYYRIPESEVIKNIGRGKRRVGGVLTQTDTDGGCIRDVVQERRRYDFFRRNRFPVLLLLRELLWRSAGWRNNALDEFLREFDPEVIYVNLPKVHYVYHIWRYVGQKTNAKVVVFSDDDDYTLRQWSLSPLYWLNRLALRHKARRVADAADIVYCISEKQKCEYERAFKRECRMLYKSGEFDVLTHKKTHMSQPIRLVFAGNILMGRWKTLAAMGRVLQRINSDGMKAQLFIYTQNALSGRMHRALDITGSIVLMGGIAFSEVKKVLLDADILVHVESFELKSRLQTRLSFSTKLVDYFESARCIFAVGWKEAASIDYLVQNDAAVVATSLDNIEIKLRALIDNPQVILDYGGKAWDCGRRNHQIDQVKRQFWADLENLCAK